MMFSTPVFPHLHCSAKYHQLVACVSKSVQICFDDKVAESRIRGIVYQNFKENTLCLDGALEIPTVPPSSVAGSPCSASFSSDANACVKTFHETFAADKSDPSLCQWVMYQSNRSFNIPHPGIPPGIWTFGKFLFKFTPPEAEKLFKCPIIGPSQVIKCTIPGKLFGSFYYAPEAVYVNMV